MSRKGLILILLAAATLLLAGCGRSSLQSRADSAVAPGMAVVEEVSSEAFAGETEAPAAAPDMDFGESIVTAQDPAQERLIIRTGDMSVVVVDTESAMDTIAQMVADNEGWVVSSNVFEFAEDAMSGSMSVRVPASGFDSFIEAVRQLSVEVTRISTSGQDVTEEYVDLTARLENLELTAARVRTFLDEARTVEDALAVSRELSAIEGEIEAIKGRMQYLEQSADFSLINISLTPDVLSQPLEVGGWQPQGAARTALETLVATLQTLADAAIWFVIYILPVALLIGIPLYFVIRYFRRRRAQRRMPVEPALENEQA